MSLTIEKKKSKFFIETYGCQMNEYDSMIANRILDDQSGVKVQTPEEADLILINTCAIRENAHTKVYNRLRSMEHLHKKGAKIGILGCMGQNLRDELLYQNLPLDFILGPDELRKLGQLKPGQSRETHLKLSRTELYDDLIPNVEHHLNDSYNKTNCLLNHPKRL